METPIADIWSLPNAREALTIFAMFCARRSYEQCRRQYY